MSKSSENIGLVNPIINLSSGPVDIKSPDSEKDTISPRSWNKTADILCNMACDLDFNDKSKKPKAIKKSSLIPKVKTKPNPKLSDYAKTRRRKGGRFVKEDDN